MYLFPYEVAMVLFFFGLGYMETKSTIKMFAVRMVLSFGLMFLVAGYWDFVGMFWNIKFFSWNKKTEGGLLCKEMAILFWIYTGCVAVFRKNLYRRKKQKKMMNLMMVWVFNCDIKWKNYVKGLRALCLLRWYDEVLSISIASIMLNGIGLGVCWTGA